MNSKIVQNEQLNEWCTALGSGGEHMQALTVKLTREQFNFKPSPDRWSVGECIEHLNISMRAYLNVMNPVIEKAHQQGNEPFGSGPFMGRLLLRALRKPGKRYSAPSRFQPERKQYDPGEVREVFIQRIRGMQQAIKRCDGLALGKITMPWPVFSWVKISLAQAFELQILHNDRHIQQVGQLIQKNNLMNLNSVHREKSKA